MLLLRGFWFHWRCGSMLFHSYNKIENISPWILSFKGKMKKKPIKTFEYSVFPSIIFHIKCDGNCLDDCCSGYVYVTWDIIDVHKSTPVRCVNKTFPFFVFHLVGGYAYGRFYDQHFNRYSFLRFPLMFIV